MAMHLGHVHIKTREDPQKVAKFYIDNFGATVKLETPGRGCQLDLHGVQLNVTTIIADQNHEQHVGIEHIAIETDDYAGALANFKKNGAQILEERVNNGRHVCWVAAPDGAPVDLVFAILVPASAADNVAALSCAARRLRDRVVAAQIRSATTPAQVFEALAAHSRSS